jgi:aspartate aminotransferase
MSLSLIGRSIGDSATLKLNALAAALRAKGEPVIHLGGGEPKSKAPHAALAAAAKLLETGEIRYTPADGIPALKQAIIRYTEKFYGRTVEPQNVIASGGAKQAIMVALQATVNPGEEVLFPAPYWLSYPEMAKLCGGVSVPVYAPDGSFHPPIQDLEAKLSPRSRAVILNSPNNPSGVMYSEEFIASVVDFCEKRDLYLIMDDIYQRLIFDHRQPANCWKYVRNRGASSKLIIVNGVSKQYAMTGFRIGWAVGNRELIAAMTCIQSHQTSGTSMLGQVAAAAALEGDQSSVEELRSTLERNRDVLLAGLKTLDRVRVTKPDGTFYCFADFRAYNPNSAQLAEFLLNKVRVVTVPGVEFGLDGYLRISYCGSAKDVTEGIERIKWALDGDGPAELCVGDRKLVRDW